MNTIPLVRSSCGLHGTGEKRDLDFVGTCYFVSILDLVWVREGFCAACNAECSLRTTLLSCADLPTVQTSSKLRFHRGSMDPILRLRIPVLTVSRVNGSDFSHRGTSFHRKLFNCFLKTGKLVPRCVKSESLTLELSDFAHLGTSFHGFEAAAEHDF
jgi:hypothetical protein